MRIARFPPLRSSSRQPHPAHQLDLRVIQHEKDWVVCFEQVFRVPFRTVIFERALIPLPKIARSRLYLHLHDLCSRRPIL